MGMYLVDSPLGHVCAHSWPTVHLSITDGTVRSLHVCTLHVPGSLPPHHCVAQPCIKAKHMHSLAVHDVQELASRLAPAVSLFRQTWSGMQTKDLHSCPMLDLDALGGLPVLPTFNGWLLGYPVVYWVDEGSVNDTAAALGSQALRLHHVHAQCSPLKVRLPLFVHCMDCMVWQVNPATGRPDLRGLVHVRVCIGKE